MATLTPDWTGRQGDRAKPFPFICKAGGIAQDISGATSVKFHLSRKPGQLVVIDAEATPIDYTVGEGQYDWKVGETDDLIGFYYAEVEVTDPVLGPRTFPEGDGEYAILFFSRQLA